MHYVVFDLLWLDGRSLLTAPYTERRERLGNIKLALDAGERSGKLVAELERVVGKRPLLVRVGGTLPIVPALADKGIPTVLTGFDLPEGNIHAPNERLLVEHIPLAVTTARELFQELAKVR